MKCFLSFNESSRVADVNGILRELKISVLDVYDVAPGRTIVESVKRKLLQADFAIFVLSQVSDAILFEVGVCEGVGKPYLLVLDKSFDLPSIFNSSRWIRLNDTNKVLLKLAIQNFVSDIKNRAFDGGVKNETRSSMPHSYDLQPRVDTKQEELDRFLEQIPQIRSEGKGLEIERFVESILANLKFKFVSNITDQIDRKGVDFAIWNDKIGKTIGNPILLEVKGGNLSRPNFVDVSEAQLLKFSEETGAKVAILLYLDRSGRRFRFAARLEPLLIAYDIEDFVGELKKVSFEKVILNARNRIAHGV